MTVAKPFVARSSARHIAVHNPYSGEMLETVPAATAREADAAVRAAAEYRSSLSVERRAQILDESARALLARADEFGASIVAEAGTATKDAAREVRRAVALLRWCAEEAKRINGEAIPTTSTTGATQRLAVTTYEPVGVVCAITPFNRPLNQIVVKVAPAIAANCTIVLKPSERTPLTALRFVGLLRDCGLPQAMLHVLTGRPEEIGDVLVSSPAVNMVTFTGSAETGARIARKAGMIRLALELGDSSALIVLADADVQAAAGAAAAGAFASAGQSCRGVKRIIVDETVADCFVEAIAEEARRLEVGDPADPATDIGCLIDEHAATEVLRRVEDAVTSGAAIVEGGHREGSQIWPTVLDRVSPAATLVTHETLGPCAPIIRVRGVHEAVACANSTRFGLQAGVFTRDLDLAMRCGRDLRVGTVLINGGPQFDSPNVPFGGVKDSGLGREGGKYSIREMSVVKTVIL